MKKQLILSVILLGFISYSVFAAEKSPLQKQLGGLADYVLYEDKNLIVLIGMRHKPERGSKPESLLDYCSKRNFNVDVFYTGKISDYDKLLDGNNEIFIMKKVRPAIVKLCTPVMKKNANNKWDLFSEEKISRINLRLYQIKSPSREKGMYSYGFDSNGSMHHSEFRQGAVDTDNKLTRYKVMDLDHGERRKGIYYPPYFYMVRTDGEILEIRDITDEAKYPVPKGSFEVAMYTVDTNKRVMEGWWEPKRQQFASFAEAMIYKAPGAQECDSFTTYRNSLIYVPVDIKVKGKTVTVYRDTKLPARGEPPMRCTARIVIAGTCEVVGCESEVPIVGDYIMVETLEDARLIAPCIKNKTYSERRSDNTLICN